MTHSSSFISHLTLEWEKTEHLILSCILNRVWLKELDSNFFPYKIARCSGIREYAVNNTCKEEPSCQPLLWKTALKEDKCRFFCCRTGGSCTVALCSLLPWAFKAISDPKTGTREEQTRTRFSFRFVVCF